MSKTPQGEARMRGPWKAARQAIRRIGRHTAGQHRAPGRRRPAPPQPRHAIAGPDPSATPASWQAADVTATDIPAFRVPRYVGPAEIIRRFCAAAKRAMVAPAGQAGKPWLS
jgi:hypothetical protein